MMHTHHEVRDVSILRNPPGPSHRLLPSLFPGLFRVPASARNRSKIGQKSVHFLECEFVSYSPATTYNFHALKCTDFPIGTPLRRRRKVGRAVPSAPHSRKFVSIRGCRPKLNKTERFRTQSPGGYWTELNKTV